MNPVTLAELDPKSRALAIQQIGETKGSTALATVAIMPSSRLAKLEQARQMLAECRTLPEVKKIRDIAEAAKVYAKAAHLGQEAQNYAAEIALLAERKAARLTREKRRESSFTSKTFDSR